MRSSQDRDKRGMPLRLSVLALLPVLGACDVTYALNIPEAGLMLEATIGAVLWAVANVVYFDRKRKGLRGASRFFAFWFGTPTTWVTFFLLPEGHQPTFGHTADEDDELLREVRRDRLLRERSPTFPENEGTDAGATPSEL